MTNNIEERLYVLIRPFMGMYLFDNKKKQTVLTPKTGLDTDLKLDAGEAGDLMDKFFAEFNVQREGFVIETYYPDDPFSWNPFRKMQPIPVPDFTISMLIESAKAGRWSYE